MGSWVEQDVENHLFCLRYLSKVLILSIGLQQDCTCRLIDVDEGQICIDGVDVSALSVDTLRQNLAIIPQDPTLFKGTLRFNLDPYNKFSDALIWKVLDKVHLANVVTNLGGLQAAIIEGGNNLSLGQRQLLCLAR